MCFDQIGPCTRGWMDDTCTTQNNMQGDASRPYFLWTSIKFRDEFDVSIIWGTNFAGPCKFKDEFENLLELLVYNLILFLLPNRIWFYLVIVYNEGIEKLKKGWV